ncbi:MAG: recombinase family protein [Defluviitaleaceae bacterium]|nr:recombinase family protein [Defluviitaleaceae bacterium]
MPRKSRKNIGVATETPAPTPLYNVALYARLSVEDMRKKESNSIGTQIYMLKQYAQKQADMMEFGVYQDVGKTGTNFNRPGFNRLLDDIRKGKVNCIVVKDLSRLGRNHIETGDYLERVFPFMGVRFIAIDDNYDSNAPSSNEDLVIPLKNLVNEIYAKDISKKVRSQYEIKRKRGDFCGAFAPYGYIKEGNALVVDEKAAAVVNRIFRLVIEGHSDNAISAMLNTDGILPPNRHRYEQGILKSEKHSKAQFWYKSAVKRITENTAYLGRLEQGRYKTGLMNGGIRIHVDKDDWVVALDTHPPIIDEDMFQAVQELRRNRKS